MDARMEFGPSSLSLGGFHVWVVGRQYPWANGLWDGNRLAITALCTAPGSQVRVETPSLHVCDIVRWSQECEALLSNAQDAVTLWAVEPELHLHLSRRGERVRAQISISPNVGAQEHVFRFDVGWDEVELFLEGLHRLIVAYPQRGEPGQDPDIGE